MILEKGIDGIKYIKKMAAIQLSKLNEMNAMQMPDKTRSQQLGQLTKISEQNDKLESETPEQL